MVSRNAIGWRAMRVLTACATATATLAGCAADTGSTDGSGTSAESELSQPLTLAQLKSGLARSFVPVKSTSNPHLLEGLVIAAGTPKVVDTAKAAASADKHDALSPAFLAKLANPRAIDLAFDFYMYTPAFESSPVRSSGKLGVLAGKGGDKYLVLENDLSPALLAEENANLAKGMQSYATPKYLYFKIDLADGAPNAATGELDVRWLNLSTFGDETPFAKTSYGGVVDPFAAAQNTCFTMSDEWWSEDPHCAHIRLAASTTYFGPQASTGDVFCGSFRDLYDPDFGVTPDMQAQGDADCAWALGGSEPRVATGASCANGATPTWSCVAPPRSAPGSWDLARCAPGCGQ